MDARVLRVLAGDDLVEADQVVHAERQGGRLGDGVARRGQIEAVQQKPVDQLARPHPLIQKTHAPPSRGVIQRSIAWVL